MAHRLPDSVREEAFGDTPAVESDPIPPPHRPAGPIDLHIHPPPPRMGPGRQSRRRQLQRHLQRDPPPVMGPVPRPLDLPQQRRIDQPVGHRRRLHRRLHEARHHRADRHRLPAILVQAAQLAAGLKARELPMPGLQAPPDRGDRLASRRIARLPADPHSTPCPEALERLAVLPPRSGRRPGTPAGCRRRAHD
jgi:hypothetical protein